MMNENTGTPALNEALAKFQAELPRVGKGEKADVPGKDGKRGYSYKYADLADIAAATLPLLGKFGLAFTAKPTYKLMGERLEFVLHYKLTHSSGEFDEGFYPLPDPTRTPPQQVGSAITYARRYTQTAVTGIHPDGEDDDGASAQGASYSAGDAWENAAPAQPRRQPERPGGNGNARPQQQEQPRQQMAPRPPLDPEDSWAAKVEELTTAEEARAAEAELKDAYDNDHVSTGRANSILFAIRQKFPVDGQPGGPAQAQQEPASPEPPQQPPGQRTPARGPAKPDNDAEWIRDWKQALHAGNPDMDRLRNALGTGIAQKHITSDTATVLRQEWAARNRELTEMAGATA